MSDLPEYHDRECEYASEACGCESRKALHARLAEVEGALRRLLDYALQLELLVYPNASGGDETDVIESARALLAANAQGVKG